MTIKILLRFLTSPLSSPASRSLASNILSFCSWNIAKVWFINEIGGTCFSYQHTSLNFIIRWRVVTWIFIYIRARCASSPLNFPRLQHLRPVRVHIINKCATHCVHGFARLYYKLLTMLILETRTQSSFIFRHTLAPLWTVIHLESHFENSSARHFVIIHIYWLFLNYRLTLQIDVIIVWSLAM